MTEFSHDPGFAFNFCVGIPQRLCPPNLSPSLSWSSSSCSSLSSSPGDATSCSVADTCTIEFLPNEIIAKIGAYVAHSPGRNYGDIHSLTLTSRRLAPEASRAAIRADISTGARRCLPWAIFKGDIALLETIGRYGIDYSTFAFSDYLDHRCLELDLPDPPHGRFNSVPPFFGTRNRGNGVFEILGSNFGFTPMALAAWAGQDLVIDFLVQKGADINLSRHWNCHCDITRSVRRPLHIAICEGRLLTAKRMLELGATPYRTRNILDDAVASGDSTFLKLIQHRFYPREPLGRVLKAICRRDLGDGLAVAARTLSVQMTRLLLEAGADILDPGNKHCEDGLRVGFYKFLLHNRPLESNNGNDRRVDRLMEIARLHVAHGYQVTEFTSSDLLQQVIKATEGRTGLIRNSELTRLATKVLDRSSGLVPEKFPHPVFTLLDSCNWPISKAIIKAAVIRGEELNVVSHLSLLTEHATFFGAHRCPGDNGVFALWGDGESKSTDTESLSFDVKTTLWELWKTPDGPSRGVRLRQQTQATFDDEEYQCRGLTEFVERNADARGMILMLEWFRFLRTTLSQSTLEKRASKAERWRWKGNILSWIEDSYRRTKRPFKIYERVERPRGTHIWSKRTREALSLERFHELIQGDAIQIFKEFGYRKDLTLGVGPLSFATGSKASDFGTRLEESPRLRVFLDRT